MVNELRTSAAAGAGGQPDGARPRPARTGRLATAMLARARVTGARVVAARLAITMLAVGLAVGGCGSGAPGIGDLPGVTAYPTPTCGGARIGIQGALDCDALAGRAIAALAERLPDQLARGVVSIEATLGECPFGEVPPQVACQRGEFVQFVTVTFEPPVDGGPIEPYLTVALEPVDGRVLGIVNPLIL